MRGKWLQRVRKIHTWLGVFFSPLLLLFIVTGWWQTFATEDSKGAFNDRLRKLSNIHTDAYYPSSAAHAHGSMHFKILVGCMAVTLIVTICLGLALACQTAKKSLGAAAAFLLGILVPALILYFN